MTIHWRDIDDRLQPGQWDGLLVSVERDDPPGCSVSVCPPDRLQISVGDAPVYWARIWNDYFGYEFLRKGGRASWSIMPPIPFALAHETAELAPEARLRRWAREYAAWLSVSPSSPLGRGEWMLAPQMRWHRGAALATRNLDGILAHEARGDVAWDDHVPPLPLRAMSPPDEGRVKAWRKLARREALPPVLLQWISGLVAHVVLDGHDRLLAAQLEGKPAPFLCLDRVATLHRDAGHRQMVLDAVGKAFEHSARAEYPPGHASRSFTPAKANRILLDAFMPQLVEQPTVAGSVRIDPARWEAEVRAEGLRQGVDVTEMLHAEACR